MSEAGDGKQTIELQKEQGYRRTMARGRKHPKRMLAVVLQLEGSNRAAAQITSVDAR